MPMKCLGSSKDMHVHHFGLCGRLIGAFQSGQWVTGGDSDAFLTGEVESGKRLCVVPGGKKGTEEQHMGHASQVLCMAISSDGKYLVRGGGSGAATWGGEVAVGSLSPFGVLGCLMPRCTLLAQSRPSAWQSQKWVPRIP